MAVGLLSWNGCFSVLKSQHLADAEIVKVGRLVDAEGHVWKVERMRSPFPPMKINFPRAGGDLDLIYTRARDRL